jgi:hypothetical protein
METELPSILFPAQEQVPRARFARSCRDDKDWSRFARSCRDDKDWSRFARYCRDDKDSPRFALQPDQSYLDAALLN